jgi:hypothetical protein
MWFFSHKKLFVCEKTQSLAAQHRSLITLFCSPDSFLLQVQTICSIKGLSGGDDQLD